MLDQLKLGITEARHSLRRRWNNMLLSARVDRCASQITGGKVSLKEVNGVFDRTADRFGIDRELFKQGVNARITQIAEDSRPRSGF